MCDLGRPVARRTAYSSSAPTSSLSVPTSSSSWATRSLSAKAPTRSGTRATRAFQWHHRLVCCTMEVASGPCDKAPDGRRGYLVKATAATVALLLPEVLGSRPSKRAVRGRISSLAPTVDQRCEQVDHRGQQVYHRSRELQLGEKDLVHRHHPHIRGAAHVRTRWPLPIIARTTTRPVVVSQDGKSGRL